MGWLRTAGVLGGLALWYAASGRPAKAVYPLPERLSVAETSLPARREAGRVSLDTVVAELDTPFALRTDTYAVVRDEDWLPARLIGTVLSVPRKLLYWDRNFGRGLDAQRTRALLSMLEHQPLRGVLVRVNHNAPLDDLTRLFSDARVARRNNLAARVLLGAPLTVSAALWSEFTRSDYYNPFTQTVVVYSNIDAVVAHELGHHQDYQRFSSDLLYTLARPIIPVTLYQEVRASLNAKRYLHPAENYQFYRYLIPAFFTYLLAGYGLSKEQLQRVVKERAPNYSPTPLQTLRYYGTVNLELYAGIAAYELARHAPEPSAPVAFVIAAFAAGRLADALLSPIVPFEHEKH